jgi:hypothetical protein
MRFKLMTVVWVVYGLIMARMALRMADGGAEPVHFLLMALAGAALAGLITLAQTLYRRWAK